jgi:hypothetical protein
MASARPARITRLAPPTVEVVDLAAAEARSLAAPLGDCAAVAANAVTAVCAAHMTAERVVTTAAGGRDVYHEWPSWLGTVIAFPPEMKSTQVGTVVSLDAPRLMAVRGGVEAGSQAMSPVRRLISSVLARVTAGRKLAQPASAASPGGTWERIGGKDYWVEGDRWYRPKAGWIGE